MNKKTSILVSVAIAASMLATSMSAFAYTDISADHWAKSYVDNLSGKKYVSGYEDGTYKPDNYVTRAEFAKILTNIFGVIDKNGVSISDVSDSAWYADTMKIAVKAGFVTGYSDGTVKPEANITRQEAAVMVYRAWGLSPEGTLNFTDKDEIADWAANQVATLAAKNVLNGYSDGSFKPNNNITRAEVAKIISCAIALGVNKNNTTTVPTGTTSGVLHVGGTSESTNNKTTTSSSGGSSGGGGGGGSTSSSTATKTPAGSDVSVQADIAKVVNSKVDDDEEFVVTFNTSSKAASSITVTFLNPNTNKTETMTIKEFNDAKISFTKDDFENSNININVPEDYSGTANIDLTADISVGNKKVGTSTTKPITVDDVNYVIVSLKAFQDGTATKDDLAVVVNNATSGYDKKKSTCDKWLADNEIKTDLYMDIVEEVTNTVLGDVAVTKSTYTKFQSYFKAMIKVVDAAAKYAASKDGELTKADALEYFNTTVTASIEADVAKEYVEDIVVVAKSFGVSLASKIDAVNAAVKAAETDAAKVEAVYSVYNAD